MLYARYGNLASADMLSAMIAPVTQSQHLKTLCWATPLTACYLSSRIFVPQETV